MSLKVVLNIQSLVPPLTGIGRYTLQILRAISAASSLQGLRCFSGWRWVSPETALRNAAAESFPESFASGPGGRTPSANMGKMPPPAALRRVIRAVPGAYPLRRELSDLAFRLRAGAFREYVYHEPNYVLRPFSGPRVLTVHDISHLRYPRFHPPERVRFLEKRLPGSLEQADQIITVSAFSRQELIDVFPVAPEKITPIPLGVSAAYRPRDHLETGDFLRRRGLVHGGYLLVVATLEPRKNLDRLVRAFAALDPSLGRRFPLVIAGAPGWGPQTLSGIAAGLETAGRIRRLGYVSENDLPLLYAGAGGFVFPSLYEGFGLPALEALASGVPTLTSAAASMPEVVGEAALLINPEDTMDIRGGLERLLTDDDFRARARTAGPRRAARFTWRQCAEKTMAVYARAQNG